MTEHKPGPEMDLAVAEAVGIDLRGDLGGGRRNHEGP